MLNMKLCTGCTACKSICPKQAIDMISDKDGFLYPTINKDKCINCKLCEKVCPVINVVENKSLLKSYAAYNKDENIRINSSSGGLFTIFAKEVLRQDGIVFGAMFDESFNVIHSYIEKEDELFNFRGSKYVQSSIGDTYKKCKEFLNKDRVVYFTGTPCQINGLKNYLGKEYPNLITQDFICHGVPSPKVWNDYKTRFKNIKDVSFRDKSMGWSNYFVRINEHKDKHLENFYIKAFLSNYILRSSCYECKFKTKNRVSDITLGDLWGANSIVPQMNDDKGLSLIVINSSKGLSLFNKIIDDIVYKEVQLDLCIKHNPSYIESSDMPKNRNKLLNEINSQNFDSIVSKYTHQKFITRIKKKCKFIIKKLIKK